MRLLLGYFLALLLVGLAGWTDRTFGQPSIDQIVFHLRYAEGTAMQMSWLLMWTFLAEAIAFPLLIAIGVTALHLFILRLRPAWRDAVALRAAPALAVLGGLVAVAAQFSAFSYVRDSFGPDVFSRDYIAPQSVRLRQTGAPKNLLLIYMESVEETYSNKELFGSDLLAPLHMLAGVRFDSYASAPGTNWTIGAIVGTQCGVPLRVYSEADFRYRDTPRTFLAGATCLGDILKERGYENVFLGGAALSFSGKGAFLRDHGYASAFGRAEWERLGARPDEMNAWGLYDSELFRYARVQLKDLHDSHKPFNLTLLTLNTHNPFGFLGKGCKARGVEDFEGIVHCSATQVAEFVEYARQMGYLEDTVVVILGDHLAVPNPVWEKLQRAPQRQIFNLFIANNVPKPNRNDLLPFDVFPSIVELMGFQVPGGRLALGYSGFGHPTLAPPANRQEAATTSSLRGSRRYHTLWQPVEKSARPDP
jgi:phosphoglycerol transferase